MDLYLMLFLGGELIEYQFNKFQQVTNTNKKLSTVLGFCFYEEVKELQGKKKTLVYSLIKIYDLQQFESSFNVFNFPQSLVPSNASYQALFPAVLYTDYFPSISYLGVVDIFPSRFVNFGEMRASVLTGGVKISPCSKVFWDDVPIVKPKRPINFKTSDNKQIQLSDFTTICADLINYKLIKWNKYLAWDFFCLGSSKFVNQFYRTSDYINILKLENIINF